ncbi:hypothetical protein GOV12_00250 [Candidatus Pacearchaeota archaeon]|nr:hypothetical protein [Candidatus Pacearchaeota archaeon]
MEKRIIIFLLLLLLVIFGIVDVKASLGISPPKVELNFIPHQEYSIGFQVLNVEEDQKLKVNLSGEFSRYARLEKKSLTGNEGFYVNINLPAEGGTPGNKIIGVHVKQDFGSRSGIGTVLEVLPLIIIKVPYPGKYAQVDSFSVTDTNVGESFSFTLKLDNLGSEEIEPSVEFQVYLDGELLDKYNVGRKVIDFDSYGLFEKTVSANKYSSGNYEAKAIIKLNDPNRTVITVNTTLRVGSLNVEIINWTHEAYQGKINPYNIKVESLWNNRINSIYAEVNVTNLSGESVDFFKTSPVTLNGWEKGILYGFFNAEKLNLEEYNSKITIFYENSNKTINVPVKVVLTPEIPQKSFKFNSYMIISVVIVIIVIGFIIFIIISRKKNGKKGK